MKNLLINHTPAQIAKISLVESKNLPNGQSIVKLRGKLQEAEQKNGNGRVYPREVLLREVNKYNEEFVKNRTSIGELDHPSCFIPGYSILTQEKGWVDFENLTGDEHVATLNPSTQILEFQPIQKIINQEYAGEIVDIKSKTFEASVTPNHRFILTNQHDLRENKPLKFKTAKELCKGDLIPKKNSGYYHISDCSITSRYYGGKIHCVSVPNETILVMSPNGSTFWSGNSSVVNLSNASHIVTRIWWDKNDLMGEIELLNTPSGKIAQEIIRQNIPLGISSRGLGSVKQIGESVEVQDDFSLVSFDLVSVPSTPGAYMQLAEGKKFQPNKYSQVNSTITDLICNLTGVCALCPDK